MKNYLDLIQQTFDFPTKEFSVRNNELYFHDFNTMDLVRKYGTPLKISYLPVITDKIKSAKRLFNNAFKKYNYEGDYMYCYCTKSSHFKFVLEKVLDAGAQIETSSAYDIEIIRSLYRSKLIDKQTTILCNGFKRESYMRGISDLINDGFENVIPILDNMQEYYFYKQHIKKPYKMGIRIASDEEPNFDFYTSRLGIRYSDITRFYVEVIKQDELVQLKMLHFFINSGIRDTAYYWSELSKFIYKYCELKKICDTLDTVDIGGGFPIRTSLAYEYDTKYMVEQIIENIQWVCKKNFVKTPNLTTEFGSYTVGESGATFFSIINQKLQNDKELWYMIDGSFITHLPDTWGKNQKFIMLPLNYWDKEYQQVHLGGLTCDSDDYYNSEVHSTHVFLPVLEQGAEPLVIGFFHTGAYQESLGGVGGIQHCLIPAARHVIIDLDNDDNIITELFSEEQPPDQMLKILGYK
ncbi:MAG: arginine decarboxylase [Cytophagales bacterium]|nr:arginine decarboxylase [Cytophagales bacterium]MDW8383344.1 arginine decarboxylase [Flammeovirgaceae bacterium]